MNPKATRFMFIKKKFPIFSVMFWGRLHRSKNEKITAWLERGNDFYCQKKFAKAIPFYKKILKINSVHYAAILNLAVCYFETEHYAKAIPFFKRALEQDSTSAWTHNYLSQALQKEGNFEAALTEAWTAVTCDGNDDNHHLNLAYAVYEIAEENEKKIVDSVLKKWREKYPENPVMKQCFAAFYPTADFTRSELQYVEKLFDVFAVDFDDVLAGLNYDSPKIIAQILHDKMPENKTKQQRILDLGCGTGLCGAALKKTGIICDLTGVDISAKMLACARQKNLYKALVKSDIESYLNSARTHQFDGVVMADVLTYFGEVENLMNGVKKILKKEGFFIFSFSLNFDNDKPWFLKPSSRFVHTEKYIENTLQKTGFRPLEIQSKTLRKEGEKDVIGQIILAKKISAE